MYVKKTDVGKWCVIDFTDDQGGLDKLGIVSGLIVRSPNLICDHKYCDVFVPVLNELVDVFIGHIQSIGDKLAVPD